MPALAFAELEWQSAPMRGSNGAVALARLPDLGDGAFRAFVRFPAGWSRPGAGHYAVAEQFLVLGGDLTLDEPHVQFRQSRIASREVRIHGGEVVGER